MKLSLVLLSILACLSSIVAAAPVPTFLNPNSQLEVRVNDLFNRLTEKEKLSLLTGTDFTSQPIPRLGLKGISFADAGQGVRGGLQTTLGPATAFPSETTMASAWDRDLLRKVGGVVGLEAKNKGTGIQIELGPAVNIHRTPYGGRNGEYMSEDPFLAGNLATSFIEGLQANGVGACVKHFAVNNQETNRTSLNVTIGQRALREIYLPAFEDAVTEGHVWSVMPAYNQVNGKYCTANPFLLKTVLRKDWGFDGLALSDWGAVHETAAAINGGTDLEMPGPGVLTAKNIEIEIANGHIKQATIDKAIKNILRTMIRCGLANPVKFVRKHTIVGQDSNQDVAYEAALEGIVLLKNNGNLLPLSPNGQETIAVIGSRAKSWQIDAGGSPKVLPSVQESAYDAIVRRLAANSNIKIVYSPGDDLTPHPIPGDDFYTPDGKTHGLLANYFPNNNLSGKPTTVRTDRQVHFAWGKENRLEAYSAYHFSARWRGKLRAPVKGLYTFSVNGDDGARLWIGSKEVINHWTDGPIEPRTGQIHLVVGRYYPVRLEYYQGWEGKTVSFDWLPPSSAKPFRAAVEAARMADVAIVFVGSQPEAEAEDRSSIQLIDHAGQLIKSVTAANPHTIVVVNNGGPVLLNDPTQTAEAVIEAGFPGEWGGKALASILFGDFNPSGKLVDTYAYNRKDYGDYGRYPGVKGKVTYSDGIYVGYRSFDKRNIRPLYPFGYGLSYTTFSYGSLALPAQQWNPSGTLNVSAQITNTGTTSGAEVAELYIEPIDPKIDRPVRELKGFNRVNLAPGEAQPVTFSLTPRDFAYFDVPGHQWRADAGDYKIEVGGSSRSLPLQERVTLTSTWTQPVP